MRTRARVDKLEQARRGGAVTIRVWLSDGDTLHNYSTGQTMTRGEWEKQAATSGARIIRVTNNQ